MMYKFINKYSVEKYEKDYVYVDGLQISNPSREVLLMANIKPLREEEVPVCGDTQYVTPYYEETESEIVQKWEIHDMREVMPDADA